MNEPITRENYREYDAINYSKLKALSDHPQKVLQKIAWSEGLQNGDLLDLILFDGEEKLREKYYISSREEDPSDKIKEIIQTSTEYDKDTLVSTARMLNYGGANWGDDTIYGKIIEKGGSEYIEELEEAGNRKIITFEQYAEMKRAASLLRDHPFTKDYFTDEWQNQVPLLYKLNVSEENAPLFKGLLDGLSVVKNVAFIFDLKYTSRSLSAFRNQFFSWKYYLQASLYTDLALKETDCDYFDTKYVVYSSQDNKVGVFNVDSSMYKLGKLGGTGYTGKYIKGYRQLAKELIWHQENDLWEYPYEVYQNNGIVNLEFNSYEED